MDATQQGTDATVGRLRLNVGLFDRLATKHGATTNDDRARLISVDRATFFRWRGGYSAPSLDVALRIASQLGVRVDRLWQRETEADEAA